MQVDYLWIESFRNRHIKAQWELIAIISVPWEAEAVIYQEEFVGSIAVAVVDLFTSLDGLTVLVY